VKEQILQTLKELRAYALQKGGVVSFFYQEEDSHLMRFANSAISLNTNEHLVRLDITAYDGRKRASYGLITGLDQTDAMKRGVDTAMEMAQHAQALTYQPTIPLFAGTFVDEKGFDPALAEISNAERLEYFNRAGAGLETDEIKLSGIFSNGSNTFAQINTRSEHAQYFKTSDAQITVVLSNSRLKWEVIAEQSAQKKSELDPQAQRKTLALMIEQYQKGQPQQLPLGEYDIVLGTAATAALLEFMGYIGYDGGEMKRDSTFLTEKDLDQQVLSDQFTLTDDPTRLETFPFQRDFSGIQRKPYPIFKKGVFQSFIWGQDDADEFGAQPSGHTVPHTSMALGGGKKDINTLEQLLNMPREKDLLFIPYLHYIGLVNPTEGILTASSRFGALLLKKDGTVAIPYNVRLTHSLRTVFGDKIAWISSETRPYNISASYDARNPTAIVAPKFICIRDLEISHSNSSY
jgi:predicted Zn-dependent protease